MPTLLLEPRPLSPDGTRIIDVGAVRDNHGNQTSVPALLNMHDLAWSLDDAEVAGIALDEQQHANLYVVPLDGSPATKIVSYKPLVEVNPLRREGFRVERLQGLSWGPAGIAFIGTFMSDDCAIVEQGICARGGWMDGEVSAMRDTDQVYVVDPAGGEPQRWTNPDDVWNTPTFHHPQFAPNGDLWVSQLRDGGNWDDDEFVIGVVSPGAALATRTIPGTLRWVLSPDGTLALLPGQFAWTVVNLADGSLVGRINGDGIEQLHWQPCPDGVCAPWGIQRPVLGVRAVTKRSEVRVITSLVPAPPAGSHLRIVKVWLQKRKAGRWRTVTTRMGMSFDDTGVWNAPFTRPRGKKCRAVVATLQPSPFAKQKVTRPFACRR